MEQECNRAAGQAKGRKAIVVTGASSGIGRGICERLLVEGYEVYGIGRSFASTPGQEHFHPMIIDMRNTGAFYEYIKGL